MPPLTLSPQGYNRYRAIKTLCQTPKKIVELGYLKNKQGESCPQDLSKEGRTNLSSKILPTCQVKNYQGILFIITYNNLMVKSW